MLRESDETYEFGEFRLNVNEHRLERLDGSDYKSLPEKSFRTLIALLRKSGTLVTKEELISAVWPDTIVEENNLGKAIHAIRRFLSDSGPDHKYIETVPKHGYRFTARVTRLETNGDAGAYEKPRSQGLGSQVFPSRSPAYDLYIRGKVKAGSENVDDTENAIKVLEAAIAIDPFFAPAYAQLARAYNTRAFKFSAGLQRKLLLENADVAVEKALSLEPNLAECHFARGLILWSKGFPHEQAIQSYKRALGLDARSDETHHQLSMIYGHIGLLEEALQSVRKAIEINPNNTMARFRVSNYLAWQGSFDDALAVLKTVPRDVSQFLTERIRAETLTQIGRLDEAEAIVDSYLKTYPKDDGGSFTSVKAVLLAKRGKRKEAEKTISRAARIGKGFGHFHHTAYNIASAYAALNDPEEAVMWLQTASDDGFPNYTYFKVDPNLDGLRKNQQFIDLMATLQKQWKRFKRIAGDQ